MIILILRMIKPEKLLNKCLSQYLLFHHSTMCPLTENYLLEKSLKQKRKLENIFIADSNLKLKSLRAELSIFSPSFFTKSLPMFEAEKILVTDKSANHIENSYVRLEIPTGSSPELQETLKKFTGDEIRIGRIMEVMDSMAGMIGYRHCFGSITQKNSFIFVTGSVDSINLFSKISCKSDITLEGYINKVGKTSMEIEINLFQDKILKSNALFTMISRSAENHNNGYQCPKLLTTSLSPVEKKKAQIRSQLASQNTERRKKQMKQSYYLSPPKPEQISHLHTLFLNKSGKNSNAIPIKETEVSNTLLMHSELRNVHHKIFGGFLMREMIEVGWTAANYFVGGEEFSFQDITNIYFKEAVEIGSGLKIVARITYTEKNLLIVTVEAFTIDFSKRLQKLSCYLHIFLKAQTWQKRVQPESYGEGLQYLDSMKTYKMLLKQSK